MRSLTEHIVIGAQAAQLKINVLDEPALDGASHDYVIAGGSGENPVTLAHIRFENGPVNGVTDEALLAIVIDRLRGIQGGPLKGRENAIALTHIEEALMWLQRPKGK
jgi:hypothetical protein